MSSSIVFFEGPPFFDFLESRRIVREKEENFQHSGRESRILENIARLRVSGGLAPQLGLRERSSRYHG